MQDYNTIIGVIRLSRHGGSQRECQSRYSIGSSTCQRILKTFQKLDFSLEDLEGKPPNEVISLFYPEERIRRKKIPLPDFKAIHERLMSKGNKANLFYLWTQYKKENPDGYQYTQFVEYYNRYLKENYSSKGISMAVERIPGEKLYIDWVGDQPAVIMDTETGEMKKVHIFVTTLGVSSYMYAELFENEKISNFVAGTVHALEMYGAVPKYLVPDNAATAVTKHTKDKLIINSTYQDLERFYGTIVLPPPVYKPKGKPTVEKHVQILETWLIERLKEHVYTRLSQANETCKEVTAEINGRAIRGCEYTRREMFEKYDKPQMKELCDGRFSVCDYVAFSRVPDNYHLFYDDHYYSVNYTYCGKPVILKATIFKISICDENNRLICEHDRSYEKYPKYITKSEHMPARHRFYQEVNTHDGNYYRRWASAIGSDMTRLIDIVLLSAEHEEQMYRSCNGILHMCDNRSKIICNEAAARCVQLKSCTYTCFKRMLNEMMTSSENITEEKLPEHKNIRGKDYYK